LVSKKDNQFSFVHKDTLTAVDFVAGFAAANRTNA